MTDKDSATQTPATVDYGHRGPIREYRNGGVIFDCPYGHGPMQITWSGGAEAYECSTCDYGYDPERD